MARKTENTHFAINTVQYYDEDAKRTVEIKAGTHFKPHPDLVEQLTNQGAIRELTDADRDALTNSTVAGSVETDDRGVPAGYARGTTTEAPVYSGGVTNPNDIPSNVEPNTGTNPDAEARVASSDSADKLPGSRTTKR